MPPFRPAIERFMEKVHPEPNTGCHLWTGARGKQGYGTFSVRNVTCRAHRWAYENKFGEIPAGALVLHRCDTPLCVNPDHLFLGSHADNHADKSRKGRAPRGESNPASKVTEQQVREIRAASGTLSAIGEKYGLDGVSVLRIRRREAWRHVK